MVLSLRVRKKGIRKSVNVNNSIGMRRGSETEAESVDKVDLCLRVALQHHHPLFPGFSLAL